MRALKLFAIDRCDLSKQQKKQLQLFLQINRVPITDDRRLRIRERIIDAYARAHAHVQRD